MVKKSIYPAVCDYMGSIADVINSKKAASSKVTCEMETDLLINLSSNADKLHKALKRLEKTVANAEENEDVKSRSEYYRDIVLSDMADVRRFADELETLTADDFWPFPTYTDLLYSVV